jgi:hypothetical protein
VKEAVTVMDAPKSVQKTAATDGLAQPGIIGISVSTNYADLLPLVLKANTPFLKKMIVVTAKKDVRTLLALLPYWRKVKVLFWDFQNEGRIFDKGGAMAHAQAYAYRQYPKHWYLNLDSDICLPSSFSTFIQGMLPTLNPEAIYGAKRLAYLKKSDYLHQTNAIVDRMGERQVQGYFQLYQTPALYEQSRDASVCDVRFTDCFTRGKQFILDLTVSHLGPLAAYWTGRTVGSGFEMDV